MCGEDALMPEVEANSKKTSCVIGSYPPSSYYSFSGNLRFGTEGVGQLRDKGGIRIEHEYGTSRLIPFLVQLKLEKRA